MRRVACNDLLKGVGICTEPESVSCCFPFLLRNVIRKGRTFNEPYPVRFGTNGVRQCSKIDAVRAVLIEDGMESGRIFAVPFSEPNSTERKTLRRFGTERKTVPRDAGLLEVLVKTKLTCRLHSSVFLNVSSCVLRRFSFDLQSSRCSAYSMRRPLSSASNWLF